jgi:ATP-binding cassette subfamily F protein uup
MLPRGVEEYLERRLPVEAPTATPARSPEPVSEPSGSTPRGPVKARAGSAEEREARKTVARIDKQLARIAEREAELHAQIEAHLSDYERLADLGAELDAVLAEKEALELEWLEAAEALE